MPRRIPITPRGKALNPRGCGASAKMDGVHAPRSALSASLLRREPIGEPALGFSNGIPPLNENTSLKLQMTNSKRLEKELQHLVTHLKMARSVAREIAHHGSTSGAYHASQCESHLETMLRDLEQALILEDLDE